MTDTKTITLSFEERKLIRNALRFSDKWSEKVDGTITAEHRAIKDLLQKLMKMDGIQ